MNESSLYVDVVQTVDELKHYFSDVPLVMRAVDMIESLFAENEELRKENDELSEDLNRARDNINDAIYCLEKVAT